MSSQNYFEVGRLQIAEVADITELFIATVYVISISLARVKV